MNPLLMVFDGNNLLIRAHHAMQFRGEDGEKETLKTSDGRESGALYGVIKTFVSYLQKYQPTHVLWVFDSGRSRHRLQIRDTYKANRGPEDKGMKYQFSNFDQFLSIVGARHYREEGVEADDLLAAAAIRWQSNDMPVALVSADHDIRQLVTDHVSVIKPSMGTRNPEKVYNVKSMRDAYGLSPQRLPELWALTGDSGDNIEGIRGVGPKTAFKMIEHQSLRKVISDHPKVKGHERKVEENFRLIKLDGKCAEFHVELEECVFQPQNLDLLLDFLKDWEMESLVELLLDGKLFPTNPHL